MTRNIRKAVFPVAGYGTRFLPVTKSMPKELLPVLNKPLIQYAVEEAVAAGCDTLVFITGRHKRAIEDHFDRNLELENILRLKGKNREADVIENIIPKHVKCIFIRQAEQLGLGDAVLCSESVIGEEPFAVLLADDLLISEEGVVTADLIDAFKLSGKCQLSVQEINPKDVSLYGMVKPGKSNNSVSELIEKPNLGEAPSNLASIGRYILTSEIFNYLRIQKIGAGGEIQLADSINLMAKANQVESMQFNGSRFDCGSLEGYFEAIVSISKEKRWL